MWLLTPESTRSRQICQTSTFSSVCFEFSTLKIYVRSTYLLYILHGYHIVYKIGKIYKYKLNDEHKWSDIN